MKLNLLFVLLVLSTGCSTPVPIEGYELVTNAINAEDWNALRKLARPGMRTNDYITMWENSARSGHPVHVGKLTGVEKNFQYYGDRKPCTMYSFALENKDATPNPHLLQVLVRKEGARTEILDFWNFGW